MLEGLVGFTGNMSEASSEVEVKTDLLKYAMYGNIVVMLLIIGQAMTGRLKYLTPALKAEGITVTIPKQRSNRGRISEG